MQTSNWNDLNLSRMMLGTVQFGLPYGVANRVGQPTYPEVVRIIAAAVAGGVNCFDTAAAYGTSEEVLGLALHELGITDDVTVVTKVMPISGENAADPAATFRAIEQSIDTSRRRLRLDCLPVVLFHREVDATHLEALHSLRQRGWVQHVGVSCDNFPGPATKFASFGSVSALQIPANIVDRRHRASGVFEVAQSCRVAIFVRSVYLQGLLVMPEDQIPVSLREIIPVRDRLTEIARQAGLTLPEMAVRYLLSQSGVTSVIVGVESVPQVIENLSLFRRGPLPEEVLAQIEALNMELTESVITPSQWPARAAQ